MRRARHEISNRVTTSPILPGGIVVFRAPEAGPTPRKRRSVCGVDGKPLLMLAQAPYDSPIDYRDMLRQHSTAAIADSIYSDWLLPIVGAYQSRERSEEQYAVEQRARGELRNIAIGDPIAEFESDEVPDYFVPTAAGVWQRTSWLGQSFFDAVST